VVCLAPNGVRTILRVMISSPDASSRASAFAIVASQNPVFSLIAWYDGQQRPVGTLQKSNSRLRKTRRPDCFRTPDF
jgi:hypothetical protein